MGISIELIRLLTRFVKETGVSGKILTYGKQRVDVQYEDLVRCFQKENFAFRKPDERQIKTERFKDFEQFGSTIHQDVAFYMLGFDVIHSLDFYPDETPTYRADLNKPLPEELWGQYDVVLDSGTMEHCFNVKEVLFNSVRLLKEGGYIIHLNPVSGMVNHGFYQFSPTLYFDFYAVNNFTDYNMKLLLEKRYIDYSPDYIYNDFLGEPGMILFTARKKTSQDEIRMPLQSVYKEQSETAEPTNSDRQDSSRLDRLKALIPSRRLLYKLLAVRKYIKMKQSAHRL